MKFGIICEGLSDFPVLKNLLVGFFQDKNLPVNRLFPEDNITPAGWGNVLKFITSNSFKESFKALDYLIIQIDTDKSEEWNLGIIQIGDNKERIEELVECVKNGLINKMGIETYNSNKEKIFFAISVHSIECWLLPFHFNQLGKYSKTVNCFNSIEEIAKTQGFSLDQKNYQLGKHYDSLSKDLKKHTELLDKSDRNKSLKIFIDSLNEIKPSNI